MVDLRGLIGKVPKGGDSPLEDSLAVASYLLDSAKVASVPGEPFQALRRAFAGLGDTGVELVLLRHCADVCKLSYALRLGGDEVLQEHIKRHDEDLRDALECCLDGPLVDHSWRQAMLGPTEGGLGFRTAKQTALAACTASLAAALPLAGEMDATYAQAGILPAGLLRGAVQQRYENTLDALCHQAGPEAADEVRRDLKEQMGQNGTRKSPSLTRLATAPASTAKAPARG